MVSNKQRRRQLFAEYGATLTLSCSSSSYNHGMRQTMPSSQKRLGHLEGQGAMHVQQASLLLLQT